MKKPCIVLLPVPGAGHLMSMVEMACRLLRHHDRFSVTVLMLAPVPSLAWADDSYVKSVAASGLDIQVEHLPPPPPPTLGTDDGGGPSAALISLSINNQMPEIKAALSRCLASSSVAALVVDFFATAVIDVADEFDIPTYVYFTTNAAMLALMLHLPTMQGKHALPFDADEEGKVVEVPGLQPIPRPSAPLLLSTKSSFSWFLYHGWRFRKTKGMIVNTFEALEPAVIKAIAEGRTVPDHPTPPIYAVGPVLTPRELTRGRAERHECVKWLDEQPPGSVVFLCFGSMGRFSVPQLREMAVGLERSGQRFLWSARTSSPETKVEGALPEGFLERTRGRGMVWPASVPQVEILSHAAVGGFVTHCGWNSVLESIWCGVPMLAWPLYAEQHFNAFLMAREYGVAVELGADTRTCGLVGAAELERGVRCLMEGKEEEGRRARERSREMKVASKKAVENGGSSLASMELLARELISKNRVPVRSQEASCEEQQILLLNLNTT